MALAVSEVDRVLGADLMAGSRQTVLAQIRHHILLGGAAVAGEGNDVDERRLIILLRDGRVIHALGDQHTLIRGAHGKTHGKADPLAGNGPLQKDGFPVQGILAGDDFVGKIQGGGVVAAFVGELCHFFEHILADVCDQGWNSSHFRVPPIIVSMLL